MLLDVNKLTNGSPGQPVGSLEIIRESLVSIVKEMRANLIRSAYSPVIYEGHDFSCALLSGEGKLLAQSLDDNPLHIFAVPYSAREIIKDFENDIADGDVFIHNDPYTGGTHLNDVLMLRPVFFDGHLVLFVAARCHWGDIGGSSPGSISGRVTEILHEGLRIRPTKVCAHGVINQQYLNLLYDNMRMPHERRGDFETMFGTTAKARERVLRLIAKYGHQSIREIIAEMYARAQFAMEKYISDCPDGCYYAEGYIEANGSPFKPLIAKLKLTIQGKNIIADFTGTAPQTAGPTNVGPSMAFNSVCTIVKSFLDPFTAINHGSFVPITVIAPEGSFINARAPAPCGGMVEVKSLLDALVISALGQAIPAGLTGGLKGGANHVLIGGRDDAGDEFLLYEYPAGGTGASRRSDGSSVMRAFTDGDFNSVQSIETNEATLPLMVEAYGIRQDSCGHGEHRGGYGMERRFRVLCQHASLSVLADRNVIPPYGVNGGYSGAPNAFEVLRNGKCIEISEVPGKVTDFKLLQGDVVVVKTAGGGGSGDPLARSPNVIAKEVRDGLLSPDSAARYYGVAVDACAAVLGDETKRLRSEILKRRTGMPLCVLGSDDEAGFSNRKIYLSAQSLHDLNIEDGALIELVPDEGSPLRGWVQLDPKAVGVGVSASALRVLNLQAGDIVEIREI